MNNNFSAALPPASVTTTVTTTTALPGAIIVKTTTTALPAVAVQAVRRPAGMRAVRRPLPVVVSHPPEVSPALLAVSKQIKQQPKQAVVVVRRGAVRGGHRPARRGGF